jgi:hypothetical protein
MDRKNHICSTVGLNGDAMGRRVRGRSAAAIGRNPCAGRVDWLRTLRYDAAFPLARNHRSRSTAEALRLAAVPDASMYQISAA